MQCIVIEGADARRFAQAQFSGNVDALAPGHWQWNAWLTPQGRVRALMHLVDIGDGNLLAVLRGGDAQDVCTALARYLLRAHARLTVRHFTSCAGGSAAAGTAADDEGDIVLGHGSRSLRLGAPSNMPVDPGARSAWRLEDIRQGWPSLPAGEPRFLPPALGLGRLQAVSFDKGCYPGQEIAARLRYRGGHKHGLYHLRARTPLSLPNDGVVLPKEVTPLDVVTGGEAIDALAVGPLDLPPDIPASGGSWRVVSRFEP